MQTSLADTLDLQVSKSLYSNYRMTRIREKIHTSHSERTVDGGKCKALWLNHITASLPVANSQPLSSLCHTSNGDEHLVLFPLRLLRINSTSIFSHF